MNHESELDDNEYSSIMPCDEDKIDSTKKQATNTVRDANDMDTDRYLDGDIIRKMDINWDSFFGAARYAAFSVHSSIHCNSLGIDAR